MKSTAKAKHTTAATKRTETKAQALKELAAATPDSPITYARATELVNLTRTDDDDSTEDIVACYVDEGTVVPNTQTAN